MKRLGIDREWGLIYQNIGNQFREEMQYPILVETLFDPKPSGQFSHDLIFAKFIFREDAFDPITRIRRGRFYQGASQQPSRQEVIPRTREAYEHGPRPREMLVFEYCQFPSQTPLPKVVALGSLESIWQVVGRPERIHTGELLFALKARHAFGILPELNPPSIPERGRAKVIETLQQLVDAAHREAPGSVIDRARDAAQWCLATWGSEKFGDETLLTKDLGALVRRVEGEKLLSSRAADIVRLLHSRAKPSEQERYASRPPMEDDAELAVKTVGFLIRELGWAAG